MTKTRTCINSCAFCFMEQLPKGLRPSLYLKDDDYMLSYADGTFITLTNLSDSDIERIISLEMEPLYVSFHASDSEVRKRLIGKNASRGLAAFEFLSQAGIKMHMSIVLVPGVNDEEVLTQTLEYLAKHRPSVETVGIVPVAFTKYTKEICAAPPRSFTDRIEAAKVIAQVQSLQFKSREEHGNTWVHLADEFYIYAKAPFPTSDWYDGYPQYENGIGIVHQFVDGVREKAAELTAAFAALPDSCEALTFVCGELATETMLGTLSALNAGGKARLLPVENKFFGGNVNVTALLTAEDIIAAIAYDSQRLAQPTTYVIPDTIFNSDGLTLDGKAADDIGQFMFVSDDADGLLMASGAPRSEPAAQACRAAEVRPARRGSPS